MKIAILISGFTRTLHHNFPKMKAIFEQYDCDYYLHLSNNESIDQYQNIKYNMKDTIEMINPLKCLMEDEIECANVNNVNQKRMWYKIYILNKLKQEQEKIMKRKYDMVIRIRPDLLIFEEQIDLSLFECNDNTIYGFKSNNNLCDEFNFGSSIAMDKYCQLFSFFDQYDNEKKMNNFLHQHCIADKLIMKHSNIKHKLLLSLCNLVAITGDSGTGKTTLMKHLEHLFTGNVLQLECDRYHKWERGDPQWNKFTHLNPDANHISKMCDDVFNLKVGNDIYQVDYDHSNGKFTQPQKIENKENVVICGLHTLFDKKVNELLNFKIFLDTDEKLRRFWKIKRDTSKRGYSIKKILNQIESRMEDYEKYILPQKKESNLIIRFFTDDDFDYKNLEQNPNIYLKISLNKNYNILEFMQILNNFDIHYKLEKSDHFISLLFNEIPKNANEMIHYVILKYCNNYSFKEKEYSYYSIIMSLIIYLNR